MNKLDEEGSRFFSRPAPVVYALCFLEKFIDRIREIICSKKEVRRVGKTVNVSSKSAAAALAVWITSKFGVIEPIAVAIATAIIIVVAEAGWDAFCHTASKELSELIES